MEFKHPKYYKELRTRNKLDRAIRLRESETSAGDRSPGPGLNKQQAPSSKLRYTPTGILLGVDLGPKPQAPSSKQQASSKPEPSSGS